MALYRTIKPDLWDDGWVDGLQTDEKLYFLFLLTNRNTELAGVYHHPLRAHAALGISQDRLAEIQAKFEDANKVYFEGEWVYVVNYLKHQPGPNGNMWRHIAGLRNQFPSNILSLWDERHYETLTQGLPNPSRARSTEPSSNRVVTDPPTPHRDEPGLSSPGPELPANVGGFFEGKGQGNGKARKAFEGAVADAVARHGEGPVQRALHELSGSLDTGSTRPNNLMAYFAPFLERAVASWRGEQKVAQDDDARRQASDEKLRQAKAAAKGRQPGEWAERVRANLMGGFASAEARAESESVPGEG